MSSEKLPVEGEFEIGGTAAVAPTAVDGENNVVTPEADMHWRLFEAEDGIFAGPAPTFTAGWSATAEEANPPTYWDLWSE